MKVLIINGSPRLQGNTSIALAEIAEKAMKIVESIDGMEAYFIVHEDGETKTVESSGFMKYE